MNFRWDDLNESSYFDDDDDDDFHDKCLMLHIYFNSMSTSACINKVESPKGSFSPFLRCKPLVFLSWRNIGSQGFCVCFPTRLGLHQLAFFACSRALRWCSLLLQWQCHFI